MRTLARAFSHWVLITANSEMAEAAGNCRGADRGGIQLAPIRMDRRFRQSLGTSVVSECQPRRAASMRRTSMFFIVIIASKSALRFGATPTASASRERARGELPREKGPSGPWNQPHSAFLASIPHDRVPVAVRLFGWLSVANLEKETPPLCVKPPPLCHRETEAGNAQNGKAPPYSTSALPCRPVVTGAHIEPRLL